MTSVTSGPWTTRGSLPAEIVGGDKSLIANVYGTNEEANARLIAAAPELLKACIAYLEAWNVPGADRQAAIDKATGTIGAAVAKAEGSLSTAV